MIQFLNPAWLWALTGLVVPIGIHLLSRKEGKTIPIGSLRHFDESVTAQARSIRLHEIALLLIRCAILTAIVLLLAGIQITANNTSRTQWAVIEHGIDQSTEAKPLLDSLRAKGYSIHYLADNFPEASDTAQGAPLTNYWAAIHQLATRRLNDVVMITYGYAHNLKGYRTALPANLKWIAITPHPRTYTALAVTLPGDSLWARTAQSSPQGTAYETQHLSAQQGGKSVTAPQHTITVNVITGEGFTHDRAILLACLRAVQTTTPHKLNIQTPDAATYAPTADAWTFWLNNTAPPTLNAQSIVYSPCEPESLPTLIRSDEAAARCASVSTQGWTLTKRLNQAVVLRENIVLALAAILIPQTPTPNATTDDQRVLPEPVITGAKDQQQQTLAQAASPEPSGMQHWSILIVLLILAERWLASKRNQ